MAYLRYWLLFALTLCALTAYAGDDHQQTKFLVLTDIHFNPFLTCEMTNKTPCPLIQKLQNASPNEWAGILAADDKAKPAYWQDSPYVLVHSSLLAAQQAAAVKQVKFVLVLGDFLAHKYRENFKKYTQNKSRAAYQAFVRKTFLFLNNELADAFPKLNVYVLVGNNDSYRGNYRVIPNSPFFAEVGSAWSRLIKDDSRAMMQREFSHAGYYAVNLPGQEDMRLLALNTVLFSYKVKGDGSAQAAKQELDWLQAQLEQARENKQHVLIAMHIPEGIDIYASMRVKLLRMIELWQAPYTDRFEKELADFSPEIAGVFAGHLHSNWFQVLRFNNMNEIPVLGTQSVSPVYGNQPGFKIYSYSNTTHQLDDFTAYECDIPALNWSVSNQMLY